MPTICQIVSQMFAMIGFFNCHNSYVRYDVTLPLHMGEGGNGDVGNLRQSPRVT